MTSPDSQNVTPPPDPQTAAVSAMLERMKKLETQKNWILFVAVMALGFAATSLFTTSRTPSPADSGLQDTVPGKLKVRELEVDDGLGRRRLLLKADEIKASLTVFDSQGKARAELFENKQGVALALHQGEHAPAALLMVNQKAQMFFLGEQNGGTAMTQVVDGIPTLELAAKGSKAKAKLDVVKGEPSLRLCDEDGKIRMALVVLKNTIPTLVILGPDGKTQFAFPPF
jgi:hypothetical protein